MPPVRSFTCFGGNNNNNNNSDGDESPLDGDEMFFEDKNNNKSNSIADDDDESFDVDPSITNTSQGRGTTQTTCASNNTDDYDDEDVLMRTVSPTTVGGDGSPNASVADDDDEHRRGKRGGVAGIGIRSRGAAKVVSTNKFSAATHSLTSAALLKKRGASLHVGGTSPSDRVPTSSSGTQQQQQQQRQRSWTPNKPWTASTRQQRTAPNPNPSSLPFDLTANNDAPEANPPSRVPTPQKKPRGVPSHIIVASSSAKGGKGKASSPNKNNSNNNNNTSGTDDSTMCKTDEDTAQTKQRDGVGGKAQTPRHSGQSGFGSSSVRACGTTAAEDKAKRLKEEEEYLKRKLEIRSPHAPRPWASPPPSSAAATAKGKAKESEGKENNKKNANNNNNNSSSVISSIEAGRLKIPKPTVVLEEEFKALQLRMSPSLRLRKLKQEEDGEGEEREKRDRSDIGEGDDNCNIKDDPNTNTSTHTADTTTSSSLLPTPILNISRRVSLGGAAERAFIPSPSRIAFNGVPFADTFSHQRTQLQQQQQQQKQQRFGSIITKRQGGQREDDTNRDDEINGEVGEGEREEEDDDINDDDETIRSNNADTNTNNSILADLTSPPPPALSGRYRNSGSRFYDNAAPLFSQQQRPYFSSSGEGRHAKDFNGDGSSQVDNNDSSGWGSTYGVTLNAERVSKNNNNDDTNDNDNNNLSGLAFRSPSAARRERERSLGGGGGGGGVSLSLFGSARKAPPPPSRYDGAFSHSNFTATNNTKRVGTTNEQAEGPVDISKVAQYIAANTVSVTLQPQLSAHQQSPSSSINASALSSVAKDHDDYDGDNKGGYGDNSSSLYYFNASAIEKEEGAKERTEVEEGKAVANTTEMSMPHQQQQQQSFAFERTSPNNKYSQQPKHEQQAYARSPSTVSSLSASSSSSSSPPNSSSTSSSDESSLEFAVVNETATPLTVNASPKSQPQIVVSGPQNNKNDLLYNYTRGNTNNSSERVVSLPPPLPPQPFAKTDSRGGSNAFAFTYTSTATTTTAASHSIIYDMQGADDGDYGDDKEEEGGHVRRGSGASASSSTLEGRDASTATGISSTSSSVLRRKRAALWKPF